MFDVNMGATCSFVAGGLFVLLQVHVKRLTAKKP